MKRLVLTTLTALVTILLVATSGASAPTQTIDWRLSGTAVWSGSEFLAQTFAIHGTVEGVGSYSGTLNAGTYFTTDTCGPQCAPVTGTIEFVGHRGTLTTSVDPQGLVTVISIGSGTTYSFSLPLTITGGTKSFGHASGSLNLSYGSTLPTNQPNCSVCPIVDGGELTGQVVRSPSAG
jgi:hypothetical protein